MNPRRVKKVKMSRNAIVTGSFDPVTLGHLDIIRRAAPLFDRLDVGVIINPQKHSLFTEEERAEMIRESCRDLPNVGVCFFSGLLADFVNENHYDVIVRGLRSAHDYEYEAPMEQVNAHLFRPGTEQIFLFANPEFAYLSSTIVKEVASLGGDVSKMVSEPVLKKLQEKFPVR